jgi:hypothetical protein
VVLTGKLFKAVIRFAGKDRSLPLELGTEWGIKMLHFINALCQSLVFFVSDVSAK